jgi:hypothetical protein
MKRQLLTFGFICSAFVTVAAAQQAQPPATAAEAREQQATQMVTIEGCLMREADVPGRRPIEADRERVKRDDDYILTDSKVIKGTAPAAASPRASDPQPTGTSGVAPQMFKVEKLPLDELHGHRNQRVRIEGTFRYPDRAGNVVSPATDLVKIDGTKLTSIEGTSPAR